MADRLSGHAEMQLLHQDGRLRTQHWDFHPAEKELTPLPVPGYGFGRRKRWFKNPIHATIALTVERALLARNYCAVVGIRTRSLIFGRQDGF